MPNNVFTTKLHEVVVAKEAHQPIRDCSGIFLVMDYFPDDIKNMLDEIDPDNLTEDHVKVILYNSLCCLNFISSANLMHRDIKPHNMLLNSNCEVILCDFGLARTIPNYDKVNDEVPLFKGEVETESDTEDSTPSRL